MKYFHQIPPLSVERGSRHKPPSLIQKISSTDNDSQWKNYISLVDSHWLFKLLLKINSIHAQQQMANTNKLNDFFEGFISHTIFFSFPFAFGFYKCVCLSIVFLVLFGFFLFCLFCLLLVYSYFIFYYYFRIP